MIGLYQAQKLRNIIQTQFMNDILFQQSMQPTQERLIVHYVLLTQFLTKDLKLYPHSLTLKILRSPLRIFGTDVTIPPP